MRVYYINNDGGGFADHIDVPDGLTIGKLFEQRCPGRNSGDYLIRVDRQPVAFDHVLTAGCRVSITPTKIAGAA